MPNRFTLTHDGEPVLTGSRADCEDIALERGLAAWTIDFTLRAVVLAFVPGVALEPAAVEAA